VLGEYSSRTALMGRYSTWFGRIAACVSMLSVLTSVLHLSTLPAPAHVDALAAIPADTARARPLVMAHKVNQSISTEVTFYTSSAVPDLAKVGDQSHPLHPMKGFLGNSGNSDEQGYNLIYVLDAIYHFPPSLGDFLARTLKALSPGGVIAYTDLLPPAGLNRVAGIVLSQLFNVPTPNLTSRPSGLAEYRASLEKLGYVGVEVRDWSSEVWPGFARNLQNRGGGWPIVGGFVKRAEKAGWKFLAVRASRPE
jgi:hypothetical protein